MFGLADCNNFFASCERVFNPSLEGRPVVVLSNNDGCVIARSNEAKKLGIKMGDPYFKLKALFQQHNVAVCSSNIELYLDMSARVMNILRQHSPATEVYSIDEGFLDFTGIANDQLPALGQKIVQTVKLHTGIPISLGIAPTKTLAKVAAKLCKQYPKLNGCCFMHRPEDVEKVLRRFPIEDVWGIGRKYADLLRSHDVGDFETLHRNVARYAASCAAKLRKQNSVCGEVMVFILTNRHKESLPQYYENRIVRLSVPTDSTLELTASVTKMLRYIYRRGYAYKRAGVILSDIRSKTGTQADLFDPMDRAKHDRLMKAMDRINGIYGRHRLVTAAEGFTPLKLEKGHLSQNFTTDWEQIIRVKSD